MPKLTNPLDHVRVAAPCRADWTQMLGDERVRFCGQCSLNVYNLSGMSKQEAEALLAKTEGRLCVRYYRRADGTILTQNCPVGLRALKRRVNQIASAALSTVIGFCTGLGLKSVTLEKGPVARTVRAPLMGVLANDLPAKAEPPSREIMGGLEMGETAFDEPPKYKQRRRNPR